MEFAEAANECVDKGCLVDRKCLNFQSEFEKSSGFVGKSKQHGFSFWSLLFGISTNNLEKEVNSEVIVFTDNTKLISVGKMRLVQRTAEGNFVTISSKGLLRKFLQVVKKIKVVHFYHFVQLVPY